MSLNGKLPTIFAEDVISVSDYLCRVKKVRNFCKKNSREHSFHFFYRGDCFCAKTQSNLFRYGNLNNEAASFEMWKKEHWEICKKYPNEFEQLAYMQHHQGNTRLLDFTEDPLVALRFACGRIGENCRKKVTIYNTDLVQYNGRDEDERIQSYLRLIKSRSLKEQYEKTWNKDLFVKMGENFPRIKRQKGLFLLMGNFTTAELMGENIKEEGDGGDDKGHKRKVKHELSATKGRGDNYDGYVGILGIAADCVGRIRDELEQETSYRMDYLMANEIEGG